MKCAIAWACLCTHQHALFDSKSFKVCGSFLSFTFYKTQRSYEKIMCVYFLFHWLSGENCMLLFSLHNRWQTWKYLKRNMNDGTTAFQTSLLIALTWKILFFLSFWHNIISCFKSRVCSFLSNLPIK